MARSAHVSWLQLVAPLATHLTIGLARCRSFDRDKNEWHDSRSGTEHTAKKLPEAAASARRR
eukprot:9259954-Pyramimonas_sp.AAC.1